MLAGDEQSLHLFSRFCDDIIIYNNWLHINLTSNGRMYQPKSRSLVTSLTSAVGLSIGFSISLAKT